jgi:hypothetical protein
LRSLGTVIEEANGLLARFDACQPTEVRRIQGFGVIGVAAIFDSVPHFRGHTQEIVHLARLQLDDAYQFAWTLTAAGTGTPA